MPTTSNTLLTISMITNEALRVLENNLTFTKFVNRQYDDRFGQSGAKIGDTLLIRKPLQYTVRSGTALSAQNAVETNTTLQLANQKGVDMAFTSKELALSIDEFSDRILKPAVAAVSNQIDADGLALTTSVYNAVGTPGTAPTQLETFLNGMVYLDNAAAPRDGLTAAVVTPQVQANMVSASKGLFHATKELEQQYEEGKMGLFGGMKWSMDQNCATFTVGPQGGTPLVNGANQTGASLATKGWTAAAASRLVVGDVFTIAGVYHVNPQSRANTGVLQQFVVTAAFSSDGSGNGSVSISPSITTSGAYQTVSASPADGAAITVLGTAGTVSPQSLIFHRDAFVLGCADLPLPGGVDMAARVASEKLGLSIRLVRAYDINNDNFPCRLDVLYGWSAVRPELACRVAG